MRGSDHHDLGSLGSSLLGHDESENAGNECGKPAWIPAGKRLPSVSIRMYCGLGGIFYAQPFVSTIGKCVAIEGRATTKSIDITQLAVDSTGTPTSGWPSSHRSGLPSHVSEIEGAQRPPSVSTSRLRVPEILKPICEANLDFRQVPMYWDQWVHLIASVYSGHTSAVSVMARFGPPRAAIRCMRSVSGSDACWHRVPGDYFVKAASDESYCACSIAAEATNALKRADLHRPRRQLSGKSEDEMHAVAMREPAANIVWRGTRENAGDLIVGAAPKRPPYAGIVARCAPTRTEG